MGAACPINWMDMVKVESIKLKLLNAISTMYKYMIFTFLSSFLFYLRSNTVLTYAILN